jgi:hypothetical protein
LSIGWDGGFHVYLVVMVPALFVSPSRSLRLKLILATALVSYYGALDYCAHSTAPWHALNLNPAVTQKG